MPTPSRRAACVLAVLALALPVVAGAQEAANASVPYAAVYEVLKASALAQGHERVRVRQRVASRLPGVAPDRIELVVHARSGQLVLRPGPDGAFSFPLDALLLAENPQVTSNQPRGSLSLSVVLDLVLPAGGEWRVRDVLAAMDEAGQVLAAMPAGPNSGPVQGIEFYFERTGEGRLSVQGRGERQYLADEDGRVVLMRDSDLADPDAMVRFDQRPLRAQPFIRRR